MVISDVLLVLCMVFGLSRASEEQVCWAAGAVQMDDGHFAAPEP